MHISSSRTYSALIHWRPTHLQLFAPRSLLLYTVHNSRIIAVYSHGYINIPSWRYPSTIQPRTPVVLWVPVAIIPRQGVAPYSSRTLPFRPIRLLQFASLLSLSAFVRWPLLAPPIRSLFALWLSLAFGVRLRLSIKHLFKAYSLYGFRRFSARRQNCRLAGAVALHHGGGFKPHTQL